MIFLRILVIVISVFLSASILAQGGNVENGNNWKKIYRASATKEYDLIHTKLDVKFDYKKAYLYGKAWLTLKPHFYPSDTIKLDAKGMTINSVNLGNENGQKLDYDYDNKTLDITLNKTYNSQDTLIVYINYTAKPNELKQKGSAAITDAKGLYFINPQGKVKDKPIEIWTQGETESSSAWFPTIDKPNQKSTSQISMTVPARYLTLSNGLLTSQVSNNDSTRTDTWKMDLPHSPYLFFMAVGNFAIVKDSYKGKEVSYYVEKPFESVARRIFGLTPEMIGFYSQKLGFEYPWPKYAQMVGRDYVSGAMENTTATLHSEYLQQNARQLADGNKYEDYISHELFHQWFGDLVTAESWSNLTVNESFADFSETLWNEYKHGQDAGDEHNYAQMLSYFKSSGANKNLVRFYYKDKEDLFDRVTYEKGGRILNMLRNVVGEAAFFKSLNLYLNTYKFKNAEAQQLRLAFEEVTGKDLNWFWNEWYYNSGHPVLNINYQYDSAKKTATVIVSQTQSSDNFFTFPVAIDVYDSTGAKTRQSVWVNNQTDTFTFSTNYKPSLINFDGDKILLAEKQENKTIQDYIFQYNYAKKYVDRREAVEFALNLTNDAKAKSFLTTALSDPFYELRKRVLDHAKPGEVNEAFIITAEKIAAADSSRLTRAAAIDFLAKLKNKKYISFFEASVHDSSYSVAGAALLALAGVDKPQAIKLLKTVENDSKGRLKTAITELQESKKETVAHKNKKETSAAGQ